MADSKNQHLTPELKEIYDRVMNTSSSPKSPVQTPTQPQSTPPPAANVQQPAQANAPTSISPTPIKPQPTTTHQPSEQMPPTQSGSAPSTQTTEENTGVFLSSTPPRPASTIGLKSFGFSGDKKNEESQKVEAGGRSSKKGISKPILITLIVVFISVWSVFWLIFFGFIQR